MKKKIYVELMGGIGNQLFQYFAGLELSRRTNMELKLLRVRTYLHSTNHEDSTLEDFLEESNFVSNIPQSAMNLRSVNRSVYFLARGSKFFRRILACFGLIFESEDLLKNRYRLTPRKLYVKGYFQTHRFYHSLNLKDQSLEIRNPTDWFKAYQKFILDHNCLAIHIRRGDYISLAKSLGLLSEKYYNRAIEVAFQESNYDHVLVFSDSEDASKILGANHKSLKIEFVHPPSYSKDAESLILMSMCNGIVIANSTFSYWAALLGNLEKKIYYPVPWFISNIQVAPVTPTNWIPIDSQLGI